MARLVKMTPEQRRGLTAINERRAEIIVPGALILQTVMATLQVEELVICERALREGLIVDWMLRNDLLVDRFAFQSTIRRRTVLHLARNYGVDLARSEQVASHALSLYDQTRGLLHDDEGRGRQLLWAAALLHSCGKHVNVAAYHKHTWYLIRHGELLGYSQAEHLMVAAIARYHRRSLPKKRHESWQLIADRDQRRCVHAMALLLRLAAALDRRPAPQLAWLKIQIQGVRRETPTGFTVSSGGPPRPARRNCGGPESGALEPGFLYARGVGSHRARDGRVGGIHSDSRSRQAFQGAGLKLLHWIWLIGPSTRAGPAPIECLHQIRTTRPHLQTLAEGEALFALQGSFEQDGTAASRTVSQLAPEA